MYERVLELTKTRLVSVNKWKIKRGRGQKGYILTDEYRAFKQLVHYTAKRCNVQPPYTILMELHTSKDIDNVLKPVFDSLQAKMGDDKQIGRLFVDKTFISSRQLETLRVYIGTKSSLTFSQILMRGGL